MLLNYSEREGLDGHLSGLATWSIIRTGEVAGRWPAETPIPRELLRHLNSRKLVLLDLLRVLFESLPLLLLFGLAIHHVGPYFLDQGSNPRPLQWKLGVLLTEPPGKPPHPSLCFLIGEWKTLTFIVLLVCLDLLRQVHS